MTELSEFSRTLAMLYTGLSGETRALAPYANRDDPEQFPDTADTIRLPGDAEPDLKDAPSVRP